MRFKIGEEVYVKSTQKVGTITQYKHEIVVNQQTRTETKKYLINYGGYSTALIDEDQLQYPLDLDSESEIKVLEVLIDVSLMTNDQANFKLYCERRNELKKVAK